MSALGIYTRDLLDIRARKDLDAREKRALIAGYFKLKFERGDPIHFLGYTISSASRSNTVGILKEVFFFGDYAFKPKRERPLILDAGANIGLSTLFFKRYYPDARVMSFEAAPDNFKYLKQNIEQNKLSDVTPIFGALGKASGEQQFFYNTKRPGSSTGMAGVVSSKKTSTFAPVTVPAIRLSDYVNEEVDLLKLDVEGAEGTILSDLDATGKIKSIREMVFEFHSNEENKENKLLAVLPLLERNGFSTVIYDNEGGWYGKTLEALPVYHFMIRAYRK